MAAFLKRVFERRGLLNGPMKERIVAYRSADNATSLSIRLVSPTSVEALFSIDGGMPHPSYNQGIVEEALGHVVSAPVAVTFRYAPAVLTA